MSAEEPTPKKQPSGRRSRRTLLGAAGLFVAVLAAGAAALSVRLQPWFSMPDTPSAEIEERWTKVRGWARVDGEPQDDLDEIARGVADQPLPRNAAELPVLEADQVDEAALQSIDRLVRWHQSGAPFAARTCTAQRASLPLLSLGRLALLTSKDQRDLSRVEAVLVLAQRLRTRGLFVELAVGASLAELAASWSQKRRVRLPERFDAHRPRVEEIHAALAREAMCPLEWASLVDAGAWQRLDPKLGSPADDRPPFGLVRMPRELLVYKDRQGRVLERAHAVRSDWRQMEALYLQADREHPRSVLLGMTAIFAHQIASIGTKIEAYAPLH